VNKSETIGELAGALAMAQGEMENATKSAVNPFFKSKYADLAAVLNVVRPALAKHDISVIQLPSFDEGQVSVETVLAHKSGEWISVVFSAPSGGKTDIQSIGSIISYVRRYSMSSVCGIAQEDDDGNAAVAPEPQKKQEQAKPKASRPESAKPIAVQPESPKNDGITDATLKHLQTIFSEENYDRESRLDAVNTWMNEAVAGTPPVDTFKKLTERQGKFLIAQATTFFEGLKKGAA
jgi:hypothetical protein